MTLSKILLKRSLIKIFLLSDGSTTSKQSRICTRKFPWFSKDLKVFKPLVGTGKVTLWEKGQNVGVIYLGSIALRNGHFLWQHIAILSYHRAISLLLFGVELLTYTMPVFARVRAHLKCPFRKISRFVVLLLGIFDSGIVFFMVCYGFDNHSCQGSNQMPINSNSKH